jgi:hypothetical protein
MRWIIVGTVTVCLLAGAIAYATGLVAYDRHTGYFSPVFAPGQDAIYFVQRDTSGVSWGFGWEGFSPPASARAFSDSVSLRRLDLAAGTIEVLEEWPVSPIVGHTMSSYRPKLYRYLGVRLRTEEPGTVDYALRMNIREDSVTRQFGIEGLWSADETQRVLGSWREGSVSLSGHSRWPVRDTIELFEVYAYGAHPPALLAHDHETGATEILLETAAYRSLYPDGFGPERIAERSKREEVVRIQTLERTHAELTARFEAQGMSDHEVAMAVIDEMRRLGFYPAPDTLTARLLTNGEIDPTLPLFDIADGEMASGVFPDIEKAIASPGDPVEKDIGRYVIHRDYENSARLNDFFAAGGKRMIVRYQDRHYELTYDQPGKSQ